MKQSNIKMSHSDSNSNTDSDSGIAGNDSYVEYYNKIFIDDPNKLEKMLHEVWTHSVSSFANTFMSIYDNGIGPFELFEIVDALNKHNRMDLIGFLAACQPFHDFDIRDAMLHYLINQENEFIMLLSDEDKQKFGTFDNQKYINEFIESALNRIIPQEIRPEYLPAVEAIKNNWFKNKNKLTIAGESIGEFNKIKEEINANFDEMQKQVGRFYIEYDKERYDKIIKGEYNENQLISSFKLQNIIGVIPYYLLILRDKLRDFFNIGSMAELHNLVNDVIISIYIDILKFENSARKNNVFSDHLAKFAENAKKHLSDFAGKFGSMYFEQSDESFGLNRHKSIMKIVSEKNIYFDKITDLELTTDSNIFDNVFKLFITEAYDTVNYIRHIEMREDKKILHGVWTKIYEMIGHIDHYAQANLSSIENNADIERISEFILLMDELCDYVGEIMRSEIYTSNKNYSNDLYGHRNTVINVLSKFINIKTIINRPAQSASTSINQSADQAANEMVEEFVNSSIDDLADPVDRLDNILFHLMPEQQTVATVTDEGLRQRVGRVNDTAGRVAGNPGQVRVTIGQPANRITEPANVLTQSARQVGVVRIPINTQLSQPMMVEVDNNQSEEFVPRPAVRELAKL